MPWIFFGFVCYLPSSGSLSSRCGRRLRPICRGIDMLFDTAQTQFLELTKYQNPKIRFEFLEQNYQSKAVSRLGASLRETLSIPQSRWFPNLVFLIAIVTGNCLLCKSITDWILCLDRHPTEIWLPENSLNTWTEKRVGDSPLDRLHESIPSSLPHTLCNQRFSL